MGLPSRRETLSRLAAHWANLPALGRLDRVQLHYLNGRIEVEVLLPEDDALQAEADNALAERAWAAIAGDPIFSALSVYRRSAHRYGAS
jgi:hypothetical protein